MQPSFNPQGTLLSISALIVISVTSCSDLPRGLDEYCPESPLISTCPEGDCPAGAFPCVAYCLTTYPDVPAAGMGAWCDDDRLPDYGEFCAENPEVLGCADWCASHPGQCGTSDGDADADRDAESDAEAPECETADDCDDGIDCSVDTCDGGRCVSDLDVDHDGIDCTLDCDDTDEIQGVAELCDGLDNDCDGLPEAEFAVAIDDVTISEVDAPRHLSLATEAGVFAVGWCDGDTADETFKRPRLAIIDAEGTMRWTANVFGSGDGCLDVSVASDGEGFVVVWLTGTALMGATFDTTGRFERNAFEIIDTEVDCQNLGIAFNGADRIGVVLTRRSPSEMIFTTFDLDFAMAGAGQPIGEYYEFDPAIAARPEGFLVAATSFNDDVLQGAVVTHGLTNDGSRGPYETVATGPTAFPCVSAATLGEGFVATWVETSGHELFLVTADSTGATDNVPTSLDDALPAFNHILEARTAEAFPRSGPPGAVLIWSGSLEGDTSYQVFASRLDGSGQVLGEVLDVAELAGRPGAPELLAVSSATHGVALAWVDTEAAAEVISFRTLEACF